MISVLLLIQIRATEPKGLPTYHPQRAPAGSPFWSWAWDVLAERGGPHLRDPRPAQNLSVPLPHKTLPFSPVKEKAGKQVLRWRVALDLQLGQHSGEGLLLGGLNLQHTFLNMQVK